MSIHTVTTLREKTWHCLQLESMPSHICNKYFWLMDWRERSGTVLDWRPRCRRFEPHRHYCIVSFSKNIKPSLVLVQPRKTLPFITERLLMGRKESNQTNNQTNSLIGLNNMHTRVVEIAKVCTCPGTSKLA